MSLRQQALLRSRQRIRALTFCLDVALTARNHPRINHYIREIVEETIRARVLEVAAA
jgi:hypothetical protein